MPRFSGAHRLMGGRKVRKAKPRKVNLGRKGSFEIKKPGVFRAKARRAGLSTREAAEKWKSRPGATGREAKSALGLMAMKHGK